VAEAQSSPEVSLYAVGWKGGNKMGVEHRIQNPAGEHIATIRYNELAGRWEIDALREPELEFLFNSEEEAWATWKKEFDPNTGERLDSKQIA
jgi:hypothetical protein